MSDSVGQYLNEIGAVALLTADDELDARQHQGVDLHPPLEERERREP